VSIDEESENSQMMETAPSPIVNIRMGVPKGEAKPCLDPGFHHCARNKVTIQ
jgi:hypothetical protein